MYKHAHSLCSFSLSVHLLQDTWIDFLSCSDIWWFSHYLRIPSQLLPLSSASKWQLLMTRLSKFLDLSDQKSRVCSRLFSPSSSDSFLTVFLSFRSWLAILGDFPPWPGPRNLSLCLLDSKVVRMFVCLWHAQLTSFLKTLGLGQNQSILHYDLYFMKSSSSLFKYFARGEESSQFHWWT